MGKERSALGKEGLGRKEAWVRCVRVKGMKVRGWRVKVRFKGVGYWGKVKENGNRSRCSPSTACNCD